MLLKNWPDMTPQIGSQMDFGGEFSGKIKDVKINVIYRTYPEGSNEQGSVERVYLEIWLK